MKQGPFPSPEVVLSIGLDRYYGPLRHPPGRTRLHRTAYTRPSLPGRPSQRPGPGRASPAPTPTMRPFRSPYPGGFLTAALPGSTRRPWPSPQIPGLGSPSSPKGAKITRRQDSHHATDRPLAHPHGTLDAGLRHRAFPPDAASLLPGLLAATRTGPSPAGGCELTFRSGHNQAPPPNAGHTDSGLGAPVWFESQAVDPVVAVVEGRVPDVVTARDVPPVRVAHARTRVGVGRGRWDG